MPLYILKCTFAVSCQNPIKGNNFLNLVLRELLFSAQEQDCTRIRKRLQSKTVKQNYDSFQDTVGASVLHGPLIPSTVCEQRFSAVSLHDN